MGGSNVWICAVAACVLGALGCGGAPFTTGVDPAPLYDSGFVDAAIGASDSGPSTLDQRTATPDAGLEADDARVDAGSPPDEATIPDARADAPTVGDAQSEAGDAPSGCADDLSNILGGNFHIDFDVLGVAGGGPLLEQRTSCDQYTAQWDIAETPSGNVDTYFYGGTGGTSLRSITAVNDGAWHHVTIAKVSGTLSIVIDVQIDNSVSSQGWSFATLPLLQVGRSACTSPFAGQIKNVCVTRE